MQYKRILITGGAGFIGSHLTDYLIEKGYQIRILDNLHPQVHPNRSIPSYLNTRAEFIKGDVTNRSDWEKALSDVDGVIHFAAAVGIGQSMYEIEQYVKTNSLGTALLLDVLANKPHGVKKMIVAGSMSSYGEGFYHCERGNHLMQPGLRDEQNLKKSIWEPLCREHHIPLQAIATPEQARQTSPSVYAITKKNQEDLLLAIGKAYHIPAVSVRFFNAYGPRQSLSNPYTGVQAIFISRVKNNQAPIINEDGLQSRDFIHVSDIVRAIELTLVKDEANYETFNIGSGIPTSIKQVAEEVIRLSQSQLTPQLSGKYRSFDIRHCYADISKAQKLLGWTPHKSFSQGMKELFEWSVNEESIDKVNDANAELARHGL